MNSRMEKIAEEIALTVLRNLGTREGLTVPAETLERDFCDHWPSDGSRYPINDAIDAVASLGVLEVGQLPAVWRTAADDTVVACFEDAQASFESDDYLQGTETLANAVRASLGYIAATFGWPHAVDDDLYRTAAALATGRPFPADDDNLYVLLDDASDEGLDLCSALGAVLGRTDALRCGLYDETAFRAQHDSRLFARMTITIAQTLARTKALAI